MLRKRRGFPFFTLQKRRKVCRVSKVLGDMLNPLAAYPHTIGNPRFGIRHSTPSGVKSKHNYRPFNAPFTGFRKHLKFAPRFRRISHFFTWYYPS
jgi:hypothetical protein